MCLKKKKKNTELNTLWILQMLFLLDTYCISYLHFYLCPYFQGIMSLRLIHTIKPSETARGRFSSGSGGGSIEHTRHHEAPQFVFISSCKAYHQETKAIPGK